MGKEVQNKNQIIPISNEDELFEKISELIENARSRIRTAIDTTIVYTYYGVGSYIVNFEQGGKSRAEYGKGTIKRLSERLNAKFEKGWSVETLHKAVCFYKEFSDSVHSVDTIQNTLESKRVHSVDPNKKVNTVYPIQNPFTLSWSHYLVLMRIENPEERSFYEIEAEKQNWSVRQLRRQYNSSLYERLALSKNKNEIMRLANEGQTMEKPRDVLKEPVTLEFLGLREESEYSENDLETAIINKLQNFLLEMGKGFLFEARQKRFTFNEDNFYVDLVFYNRLLQCYVIIDLKTDKLSHQDLGQMQMYVNYFDRYVKQDFEKPTIGILLCKDKDDALVELTLPKDANIYAQQYALYLPDKQLLQQKLKDWIAESEENKEKEEFKNGI